MAPAIMETIMGLDGKLEPRAPVQPFEMQLIESEIIINAPLEQVWAVLADFPNYHRWNRFCSKLETSGIIGEPVLMTVHLKPDKSPILQREILSDFIPREEMGWRLNWGFLLKTHRIQRLAKIDECTTHYYTFDKFWGVLTPLVMALYQKDMQRGFDLTARGLKAFVELSGRKVSTE